MIKPQVIACFEIYSGEDIVYQGTFQISEETNLYLHQLTDRGEFGFRHCYEGTQCDIAVTYSKGGSVQAQLKLEIPINRTKIKWKQSKLGENYDVRYRCGLEFGEHSKELRKILRRSAIDRRDRQPVANIYYIGDANSDEDV